mmetsp:Transcript_13187/g.55737  ORF Transcript_13187/g.55737 Transcript_13187/m.55737 type:complete len:201 (+) Transcript_13187:1197-1799(+)
MCCWWAPRWTCSPRSARERGLPASCAGALKTWACDARAACIWCRRTPAWASTSSRNSWRRSWTRGGRFGSSALKTRASRASSTGSAKSTGVPGPRTAGPSRRTCREPRSASSSSRVCCPTARTSTTLPVCCSRFRSPVGSPTRRREGFCPASDSHRERTERRSEAPSTSAGWRASTSWTARSALYTSPCGRRTTCPRTTW